MKFTKEKWFSKVEEEVIKCHLLVTYHNQLVAEKDNISILSIVAGTFFASVVDSYRFNIMHIISRLFDPKEDYRGNMNLSICRLLDEINDHPESIKYQVSSCKGIF